MCHQVEILHHNKLIHWSNWLSVLSIRFSCWDGAITLWFKDVLKSLARHWPSSLGWRSVKCDSARYVKLISWYGLSQDIYHFVSIVLQLVICSCLASAVWWSSFVVEAHQDEISPRWCIRLRRYHSTIVHWHRVFFYMVVLLCWMRDCRTMFCHFDISSVLLSITVVKNIDQVRIVLVVLSKITHQKSVNR